MASETPNADSAARPLDGEMLTCAIVDGINGYLRELETRGLIDSSGWDEGAGSELCSLKYMIADGVTRRWLASPEHQIG